MEPFQSSIHAQVISDGQVVVDGRELRAQAETDSRSVLVVLDRQAIDEYISFVWCDTTS